LDIHTVFPIILFLLLEFNSFPEGNGSSSKLHLQFVTLPNT
jgi:hypothetical protein